MRREISAIVIRLLRASRLFSLTLLAALSTWAEPKSSGAQTTDSKAAAAARPRMLESRFVHLRSGPVREWNNFPEQAEASRLEVEFEAAANETEQTLRLRQFDVKQAWRILLNDKPLGELIRDENDQQLHLTVPPGRLTAGRNVLKIESSATGASLSDDVRAGQVWLDPRPRAAVLGEATLKVRVIERVKERGGEGEAARPTPARVTIVDDQGTLVSLLVLPPAPDAPPQETMAVRTGVVYTIDGRVAVTLTAGNYRVYAGRGFEYSVARTDVTLAAGGLVEAELSIERQVPTPGYVACDTHIHTLTHSGHGDSTLVERMATLAGEGIELPIATDHNVHVDYELQARRLGARRYFTPVVGNEFTTKSGHFNVFPMRRDDRPANHQLEQWSSIFEELYGGKGARVVILNHPRDLHSGYRPFDPSRFRATTGRPLDDRPFRFNGVEVINSGAVQTDPLQLPRDWMNLLNGGAQVTPVGSSDSHDVSRYIVGQGRTYIRCDDGDPAAINVEKAIESFLAGRVLVSYGLLVDLTVDGKYLPGDLAPAAGAETQVQVNIFGPDWVKADRVQLYANGRLLREERVSELRVPATGLDNSILPTIPPNRPQFMAEPPRELGVWRAPRSWKGRTTWKIPRPKHDVHLVAVALGPGVSEPFWRTAKPYQPTSPEWNSYVMGMTGAVWIDGDNDGRRSTARDYAERLIAAANGDADKLKKSLADYDDAVAAQVP